jgi:hypothetical protein
MCTIKIQDASVFNKMQHWRQQNGYDLYPVLRLILPQARLLVTLITDASVLKV